jgi:hypothetical protein
MPRGASSVPSRLSRPSTAILLACSGQVHAIAMSRAGREGHGAPLSDPEDRATSGSAAVSASFAVRTGLAFQLPAHPIRVLPMHASSLASGGGQALMSMAFTRAGRMMTLTRDWPGRS